jgi:hypothetical protein
MIKFPTQWNRELMVLRVIADDETSGILAPHASTGQVGGECRIRELNALIREVFHWIREARAAGAPNPPKINRSTPAGGRA